MLHKKQRSPPFPKECALLLSGLQQCKKMQTASGHIQQLIRVHSSALASTYISFSQKLIKHLG